MPCRPNRTASKLPGPGFSWGQEIPILLQGPALSLLVVYFNLVSVVWTNNESVEVSELIIFAANLSLYQEVLPLVVEYDVDFLGSWAADVGSWRGCGFRGMVWKGTDLPNMML